MNKKLMDVQDYQLIRQLSLLAKRRVAGLVTGEQRSPAQGGGIEFADYREYQPGDDIRRIDWSVFLRLRRLLVKLCAEEKELTLMLLLDTSSSMRFGTPDKLWVTGRIASVLAGIALTDGNRAGLLAQGIQLRELVHPERSEQSLKFFVEAVSKLQPEDCPDPTANIRQFASRFGHRCMVVYISDLLFPDWNKVIGGLAASGCEGYIIQVLAPEETDPPYLGEITFVDQENGAEVPMHVGMKTVQNYRRELARHLRDVRQTCHRNGLGHTLVTTDAPLAAVFHQDLRKGGLVC